MRLQSTRELHRTFYLDIQQEASPAQPSPASEHDEMRMGSSPSLFTSIQVNCTAFYCTVGRPVPRDTVRNRSEPVVDALRIASWAVSAIYSWLGRTLHSKAPAEVLPQSTTAISMPTSVEHLAPHPVPLFSSPFSASSYKTAGSYRREPSYTIVPMVLDDPLLSVTNFNRV